MRIPGPIGITKNTENKESGKQAQRPRLGIRSIDSNVRQSLIGNNIPQGELNPNPSPQNCPATAAAMDEWLGTGRVNPAIGGNAVTRYNLQNVRWSREMNLRDLMILIQSGNFPPNYFIAVRGTRSQEVQRSANLTVNHFFLLAKVRSGRSVRYFYLDAFGSGHSTGSSPTNIRIAIEILRCSSFQYSLGQLRVTSAEGTDSDLDNPFPPGL